MFPSISCFYLRKAGEAMIRHAYEHKIPDPWTTESAWTERLLQDRSPNGKARFFRPDVWHNVQMGVGKDFASAAMVMLVRLIPASNIDDRFAVLSNEYIQWCSDNKKTKYISKLDKRLVGGAGRRDEPYGSWNKASLTVTILEFLQHVCESRRELLEGHDDQRYRFIMVAVKSLNHFMSGLYHQDLWVPATIAMELAKSAQTFVKAFLFLAYLSGQKGEPYFAIRPKLHMLHESSIWLQIQAERSNFCLNVLAESCSLDEDFVGRLAFLSRNVSPRLISQRSIERYLVQIQLAWGEE